MIYSKYIFVTGVRGCPKSKTNDGFELHFGINHLGHFALFLALKDVLMASSTPSFHSRVVSLSSSGHRESGIRFHDPHFDKNEEEYHELLAYGQSKTANILMISEIERRYRAQGLHGLAVHPGGITGTNLNRLTPADQIAALAALPEVAINLKSVEQGAATTVWAAIAKELEGKGERYLEDCQEGEQWDGNQAILAPGYAAHIHDTEAASRLWEESLRMIGMPTEDQ
jgi:NAD(P)-dependent dehydrogenase (short-subunit alcohol dehydrogenase family)